MLQDQCLPTAQWWPGPVPYRQETPLLGLGVVFLHHIDGGLLAAEAADDEQHFVGS